MKKSAKPTLKDSFPMPAVPPKPKTLTLYIQGMGHVPGKKNSKMIIPVKVRNGQGVVQLDKDGKPKMRFMLITKPEFQAVIKQMEASLKLQLNSIFQTSSDATRSMGLKQFVTHWLPSDDNWKVMPTLILLSKKVAKGCEGAKITIRRLPSEQSNLDL